MDTLQHLQTEACNPASSRLDELSSLEIVELMNREDATIAAAVLSQATRIAQAIDAIADRLSKGGRLIYCGAGTSGRLGVLDASECPPTFQTPPEQVIGLIAGGQAAMFRAIEGAEDSAILGETDLIENQLTVNDIVCGIATSGRTPYAIGAVRYAKSIGAFTIGIVCNSDTELEKEVDLPIVAVVGPEVLSGSTRLKAGTATKLILNMFTTGAMVRLGKTYGNLMVDLNASNHKLKARANRIVRSILDIDSAAAEELLLLCNGEVKTAIVSRIGQLSPEQARSTLLEHQGRIHATIANLQIAKVADSQLIRIDSLKHLVLGIDGGGTNTICYLANAETGEVLAKGTAGPSNIQSVGVEAGLKALDDAIDRAFLAAGVSRAKVAAACLGLAGVDRQEGIDIINSWASRIRLAANVTIANDATLILAAGTDEGWGLAVIAGTGSIAFVRDQAGQVDRAGGWGHLLGDEGSAYRIALSALQWTCRNHDANTENPSPLAIALVHRMNIPDVTEMIPAVYRGAWDRSAIASLAPVVFEVAAAGDDAAKAIVLSEASALAETAILALKRLYLDQCVVPVALAGGVLTGNEMYRSRFLETIRNQNIQIAEVRLVTTPVLGAVTIARRNAAAIL